MVRTSQRFRIKKDILGILSGLRFCFEYQIVSFTRRINLENSMKMTAFKRIKLFDAIQAST